jgi:hypothetical protein
MCPYHEWGDEWFEVNGDNLNSAMDYIFNYVYKYTRYKVMMKEKYGTIRYEMLYPQPYHFTKFYHKWGIYRMVGHIQFKLAMIMLKRAVMNAADLWPSISEEILEDFHWSFYE